MSHYFCVISDLQRNESRRWSQTKKCISFTKHVWPDIGTPNNCHPFSIVFHHATVWKKIHASCPCMILKLEMHERRMWHFYELCLFDKDLFSKKLRGTKMTNHCICITLWHKTLNNCVVNLNIRNILQLLLVMVAW